MPIAPVTITDASGQVRVVSAEEFTAGRRECRLCFLTIRTGVAHACPVDGSNSARTLRRGNNRKEVRRGRRLGHF